MISTDHGATPLTQTRSGSTVRSLSAVQVCGIEFVTVLSRRGTVDLSAAHQHPDQRLIFVMFFFYNTKGLV